MFDTLPLLFIFASLIVIITPGQDMLLVMSRSISQGSRAGIATAAGVSTGLMGHTLLATCGLGAILSSSLILFSIIKYVGAGYLLYIGISMLKNDHRQIGFQTMKPLKNRQMFYQGMISNISNPKITLFYFAYLPQFLPTDSGNHALRLFVLGTSFALLTFLIKAPIGYCAGRLSSWLRTNGRVLTLINRLSGVLLIALGIRLAFTSRN